MKGVGLIDWKSFIYINDLYVRVAIRKLFYDKKTEIFPTIFSFVGESLGKKYILSAKKLLKRESLPREVR